jgi:hypothetical protein
MRSRYQSKDQQSKTKCAGANQNGPIIYRQTMFSTPDARGEFGEMLHVGASIFRSWCLIAHESSSAG